jgi:Tfp pilus assembly protein PilF
MSVRRKTTNRRIGLLLLLALTATSAFGESEPRVFQLSGTIVQSDGKPLRHIQVMLFSANTPFSMRTQADAGGDFSFKGLLAGAYNLFVVDPRLGEIDETIEVGPSFADKKGRITRKVIFDRAKAVPPRHGVSVKTLSLPDDARKEYIEALSLAEKRDFEGAVRRLKHAIEIAPQFAAAWNYLGTMSFQTGAYPEAERYFREALRQDGNAFDPLVNLGGTLIALHRYGDALTVNLQAVNARPKDALAQSQLGQSYFHLDRLEEAEVHLKQAKALDPGHFSLPQLMLSAIYRKRGNYAAAISEIEEFLALHPDSVLVPYAQKELASLHSLAK